MPHHPHLGKSWELGNSGTRKLENSLVLIHEVRIRPSSQLIPGAFLNPPDRHYYSERLVLFELTRIHFARNQPTLIRIEAYVVNPTAIHPLIQLLSSSNRCKLLKNPSPRPTVTSLRISLCCGSSGNLSREDVVSILETCECQEKWIPTRPEQACRNGLVQLILMEGRNGMLDLFRFVFGDSTGW